MSDLLLSKPLLNHTTSPVISGEIEIGVNEISNASDEGEIDEDVKKLTNLVEESSPKDLNAVGHALHYLASINAIIRDSEAVKNAILYLAECINVTYRDVVVTDSTTLEKKIIEIPVRLGATFTSKELLVIAATIKEKIEKDKITAEMKYNAEITKLREENRSLLNKVNENSAKKEIPMIEISKPFVLVRNILINDKTVLTYMAKVGDFFISTQKLGAATRFSTIENAVNRLADVCREPNSHVIEGVQFYLPAIMKYNFHPLGLLPKNIEAELDSARSKAIEYEAENPIKSSPVVVKESIAGTLRRLVRNIPKRKFTYRKTG